MKSIILIICFASLATAKIRVIGGKPALAGQFPYQVSLHVNGQHSCGGSILSANVIITAAHCVYRRNPQSMSVRAGTVNLKFGGYIAKVRSYYQHPNFNLKSYDTDAALLILSECLPVHTDPNVKAIQLVNENEIIFAGQHTILSGWGEDKISTPSESPTSTTHLKYAQIPIWNHEICKQITNPLPLTRNMFCAGSEDGYISSRPGDSGGPLVLNSKLIGVVSWGVDNEKRAPEVYTSVSYIRSWIRRTVGI